MELGEAIPRKTLVNSNKLPWLEKPAMSSCLLN